LQFLWSDSSFFFIYFSFGKIPHFNLVIWNEQLTIWLKFVGTSCNVKDNFALDFLSEYLTLFKYALNCLVMSLLCLYHHDGIRSSPQDGCELHWMLTSLVHSLDALCEVFHFLSNLPNLTAITFLALCNSGTSDATISSCYSVDGLICLSGQG
jgi:hypothetical protein